MTDIPDGPQVPQTPPYVSPYGKIGQLPQRLARLVANWRQPGGTFIGLGPIADLELVMQLLSLREYGQWLQVHGEGDQKQWGDEIIMALDDQEDSDQAFADIERVVPVGADQPYADAVEAVAAKAVKYDVVRATLINMGALAEGDTETDIPALLTALFAM